MRLAPPANVLVTMGVTSNAGSLESAGRALDLALPIIENVMETQFAPGSVVDYFTTDGKALQFRLSNVFVDADSLVVRVSETDDPLFTEKDGTLVPPSEYFLNPDNGTITFRKPVAKGEHKVSVTYDHGLGESDDDAEVYAAPYWLAETAVSMAILVLNTHPSSPANRKDKTVGNVADALFSLSSRLLSARRRPRMCVEFPVRSVTL